MFNPQPKPLPRSLARRVAIRQELMDDRKAKALVKVLDQYTCRCCGKKDGVDCHEHQRRGSGGFVTPTNSYCLCRVCHDLIGPRLIGVEMADGSEPFDARQPLLFTMPDRIARLLFPTGQIPPQVHVLPAGR
jgi:hypothetical protein